MNITSLDLQRLLLLLGILVTLSSGGLAEVTDPKILAKPIGVIRVNPIKLLECIAVWTNYGGARLDFRGKEVRGGYKLAKAELGSLQWQAFLSALKEARASKSGHNAHVRWKGPNHSSMPDGDPIDVKVFFTPAGKYYELHLHSDGESSDPTQTVVYPLNGTQLEVVIGWMESALQLQKDWPAPDRNPWNDGT
jgi:hypothetical protein